MPTPDRSEHVTETVAGSPSPSMRMGRNRPVSSSLAVTIGQVLHPPVRDRRFWAIQLLILTLVLGHLLLDLHPGWRPTGIPDYPTVGLFVLPVIYAALKFGLGGACASAAWGSLLMVPDLFVVDTHGDLWGDVTLLALTCTVAVAVGQRVERELLAKRLADEAIRAHRAAEARFRALFEASKAPTLVADSSGFLREANPAAKALFGPRLGRRQLGELVGSAVARRLLAQTPPKLLPVVGPQGDTRILRPISTLVTDSGGDPLLQIILQDVTEDTERRRLTESYALEVVHVQEEERRRIGQDIHDEPLQTLIYLLRRLEAIADNEDLPSSQSHDIGAIREALVAVVLQLRQLADGLRPPVLDDLGLGASLRQLVAGFAERSPAEIRLQVIGSDADLGWDRRTDIYRIVQEALRNVERHANALHVKVEVAVSKRTVRMKIQDDGSGFDRTSLVPGLGLRGMQERALLSNGRLEVESSPGHGTKVRALLPVGPARLPNGRVAHPVQGDGENRTSRDKPGTSGPPPATLVAVRPRAERVGEASKRLEVGAAAGIADAGFGGGDCQILPDGVS